MKGLNTISLFFIISLFSQACLGQVHLVEQADLKGEAQKSLTGSTAISFPDSLSLPQNIFSAIFRSDAVFTEFTGLREFEAQELSFIKKQPNNISAISSAHLLLAPEIELPEIPLGFFCKFEDQLSRKWFPIDFGTD